METVIIVIHLMIVLAMVGAVLLQRSEGGALGIGGGGGGGFMSGRGAASALTRTTAILAAAFFVTSITLTLIAQQRSAPTSILEGVQSDQPAGQGEGGQPAQGGGVLDLLRRQQQPAPPVPAVPEQGGAPQVPQSQ